MFPGELRAELDHLLAVVDRDHLLCAFRQHLRQRPLPCSEVGHDESIGHQEEQDILFPPRDTEKESKERKPAPARTENLLEDLADFERTAAAGERLDPDNAYFPLMRAVGLEVDTDG